MWISMLSVVLAIPVVDEKADQTGKELKIIAQSTGRGQLGSRILRSSKEAMAAFAAKDEDAATTQLAKMFKVEKIDWTKQMVILVSGGVQRTGGYSVSVNKIAAADKRMTVYWKLNTPRPGQPVTQAFTHPGAMVLAEQFEGEVSFFPAPPKGKRDN